MKKNIIIVIACLLLGSIQSYAQEPFTGMFRGNAVQRGYGADTLVGYMATDTGAGFAGFVNYAGGKYSYFITDTNGDAIIFNEQKKIRIIGNSIISTNYDSVTETSAILKLSSDSLGFLVPRMTSAQKNAIAAPATGLLIYQTDGTAGFYVYNGSAWVIVGGAITGTATRIPYFSNSGSLTTDANFLRTDSLFSVEAIDTAGNVKLINMNSIFGVANGMEVTYTDSSTGIKSGFVAGDWTLFGGSTNFAGLGVKDGAAELSSVACNDSAAYINANGTIGNGKGIKISTSEIRFNLNTSGTKNFTFPTDTGSAGQYLALNSSSALGWKNPNIITGGDTAFFISPDLADTNYVFNTNDTLYIKGNNPIKIGNNSLVVSDEIATFGGTVEINSGDTLRTNVIEPSNGELRIGGTSNTKVIFVADTTEFNYVADFTNAEVLLPEVSLTGINIADTLKFISPDLADTNFICNTNDTLYIKGDNPIKIGNHSLIVSDNLSKFGGSVEITHGDTLIAGIIEPSNGLLRIGGTSNTKVQNLADTTEYNYLNDFTNADVKGFNVGTASQQGAIIFRNTTNSNKLTIGSGVTSASYSLTLPTAQGGVSTVLQNNGSGVLSWATPASGITVGTTTITSGTSTRIPFNDGGMYGEDADFTWDKTNNVLNLGGVNFKASGGGGSPNIIIGPTNSTVYNNIIIDGYSGGTFTGVNTTRIGNRSGEQGTGTYGTLLGAMSSVGDYSTTIGYGIYYGVYLSRSILIGTNISASVFGVSSHKGILGSSAAEGYINDWYFNDGMHSTPYSVTLNACGGSGTNIAGATLTLAGGRGTGNVTTGGSVIFQTANDTTSGTIAQKLKNRWQITPKGNFIPSSTAIYDLGQNSNKIDSAYINNIYTGTSPNYLTIDTTNALRLYGTATVWDDYILPMKEGTAGGSSYPVFSDTSNLYHFVVDTTGATKCIWYGTIEMSHGWKLASDLHPHLHYKHTTTAGTPTFGVKYRWVNIGDVGGAWSWRVLSTPTGTTNNTIQMVEDGIISGAGKTLSSSLQVQVYLISQTGTGGIDVQMFGVHYEIDALGSKYELTK